MRATVLSEQSHELFDCAIFIFSVSPTASSVLCSMSYDLPHLLVLVRVQESWRLRSGGGLLRHKTAGDLTVVRHAKAVAADGLKAN